jgi:phosphatidylserine/phosphatidylglycerophosphate/cardiolipin synthase-like enzyme
MLKKSYKFMCFLFLPAMLIPLFALAGCSGSASKQNNEISDLHPDKVVIDAWSESMEDAASQSDDGLTSFDGEQPQYDPGAEIKKDSEIIKTGGKIVINEIMYDPKVSEEDFGEWIELYNAGDETVDLKGWTIKDKVSNQHVISSSVKVAPGAYVVLGKSDDLSKNGSYKADYVYSDFYLGNSGDSVILVSPSGDTADSVSYKNESPWPVTSGGVSIELKNPGLDNSDGSNWQLAVAVFGAGDKGTPGTPNGAPKPVCTVDTTVKDWNNPELKASLRFSPRDYVEDYVLGELASAKKQVRMAFFNISLYEIPAVLKTLKEDGVDVDVLLDKKQQDQEYNTMFESLTKAGISVTLIENTKAEDATMHDKFTVIDGSLLITGSANYSSTAFNKSDEDLLTVENTDLCSRYLAEFDELKAGGKEKSPDYPESAKIQAWMSPEDSVNKKIESLIENAETHVLVAMFQINLENLVSDLIDVKNKGLTVLVILDGLHLAEGGAEKTLMDAGVNVILAENTSGQYSEMHSKILVVDHQIVAMGSYNWTAIASFYNDENLVIINDAQMAAYAEGKIADLITTYGKASAADLGLSAGQKQVNFSVENVTLNPDAVLYLETVGGGPFTEPKAMTGNKLTVMIEAGTRIEYRYFAASGSNKMIEGGPVHFFTIPFSPGPFTVKNAFLK